MLSKVKIIFNLQLILNIIFFIYLVLSKNYIKINYIVFSIALLILIVSLFNPKIKIFKLSSNFLEIATLPFIFRYLASNFIQYLSSLNMISLPLIGCFSCLISFFINFPLVMVNYRKIDNWFLRLISVQALMISYELLAFPLIGNSIIDALLRYRIIDIISFFIIAILILKKWKINFRWNFTIVHMTITQALTVLLLLIFSIWLIGFNQFGNMGSNLSKAFFYWKDIIQSSLNINTTAFLKAITPSFMEEIERFFNISILLLATYKMKYKRWTATLGSAFIFSVGHWPNLLNHISLNDLSTQIITTFSMGCLFAVIYLCTGKLWLIIAIHFLNDLIGFSITSTSPYSLRLGILTSYYNGMLTSVLIFVLPLLASVLILSFKETRQLINNNIQKAIN